MTIKKTKKTNEVTIDAEFVNKDLDVTKEDLKSSPNIDPIQMTIDQLTKQHTEKGTLAFEFLKSLVSGKAPLAYDDVLLEQLTVTAFKLSDLFKHEMDVRWATAMTEVSNKFSTTSTAEKSILQ